MRDSADVLEADLEDVARILTTEMGKPIVQARAEVAKSVKVMRFYADHAERFLAAEPLADPAVVGASRATTRYEPLGIVLAVMPWNYPIWQVIRFAAPALMAGNTGLLKHASNVPQSALYLDTLFRRGGFPEGSFQTLLIGSGDVSAVLEDRRVKAVTLTGSEPAGRAVAETAGRVIKKSVHWPARRVATSSLVSSTTPLPRALAYSPAAESSTERGGTTLRRCSTASPTTCAS